MADAEHHKGFESKWFAVLCVSGYGALSVVLLWVYGAGPSASFITRNSLGVSVIIVSTTLNPALRRNVLNRALLIFSGWIGALIAWALCIWNVYAHQRGTWMGERAGESTAHILILLVIVGVLYAVFLGGHRLLRKTPASLVAAWSAIALISAVYESIIWFDRLFPK